MTQEAPSVAAIIVNYAAAPVIIEHLDKLVRELNDYPNAHIFIVDNESPNDDAAELRAFVAARGLESFVTIIDAGANLGFAGGNNIGFDRARAGGAEFIFFLNPDAYPLPGAVDALVKFLQDRPDAAVAGAQLQSPEGGKNSCCFRFPTLFREFANETEIGALMKLAGGNRAPDAAGNEPVETDWVSGTAFLLRVEAAAPKLMDDRYFLYYEETDMMRELRRRGWRIWHVPEARVVHIGGVSTGVQHDTMSARRLPGYWFDSWRLYYRKNHGALYARAAGVAKTLGVLIYYAKRLAKGKKSAKPQRYLSDVVRNCLLQGRFLKEPRP